MPRVSEGDVFPLLGEVDGNPLKEEILIYSPKLQVSLAIGAAAPEDEFRKGWD